MSELEFDNPGDVARDISRDDLSRAEHVRREIAARRELDVFERESKIRKLFAKLRYVGLDGDSVRVVERKIGARLPGLEDDDFFAKADAVEAAVGRYKAARKETKRV
jgi:hypothetical protein